MSFFLINGIIKVEPILANKRLQGIVSVTGAEGKANPEQNWAVPRPAW